MKKKILLDTKERTEIKIYEFIQIDNKSDKPT